MKNILTISILIFASCGKMTSDGIRIYTIPEGKHYSKGIKGEEMESNTIYYRAMFKPNCKYFINSVDSMDLNKRLIGFVDCNSTVHRNSARFGDRAVNDMVEITTYVYNDQERLPEKPITFVNYDEWFYCAIGFTADEYIFSVNGIEVTETRTNKCDRGIHEFLYSYQGGNIAAQHEMTILIEMLD